MKWWLGVNEVVCVWLGGSAAFASSQGALGPGELW